MITKIHDSRNGKSLFAIRDRRRAAATRRAELEEERLPPRTIEVGPPIPDRPLPPKPEGAVGVQPWGVLPAKPPGRSR